jgi:beta-aspartyl-peptidase (threonine type)
MTRIRSFSLFVALLITFQSSFISIEAKPARKASRAAAEVRAVLDAQVVAWNAGNIEDFMKGYWRSPELSFYSGGNRLSGWDATIERYRKNYQSEGREMGKLQFTIYDISVAGKDAAFVRGRFELMMSDGKKPTGLFTLLLRRFSEGWKIIHDHTSTNN